MRIDKPTGAQTPANSRINKTASSSSENKKYFIRLTRRASLGALLLLLIGFVWVFAFGVILGRGYKPEKDIPELAKVMPGKNDLVNGTANSSDLLRPEDLEFYARLQEKTSRVGKSESPERQRGMNLNAAARHADQETEETAGANQRDNYPVAPAKESLDNEEKKPEKSDVSNKETRYAYVYQVAAFYDNPTADKLAARIKGKGIQATIERSITNDKTYYKVLAHVRGTEHDAKETLNILNKMGLEKPIRRSKNVI